MNQATSLFSAVAAAYARHRITHPAAFFEAFLGPLVAHIGTWSAVQRSR
jgi:hypothetical protein